MEFYVLRDIIEDVCDEMIILLILSFFNMKKVIYELKFGIKLGFDMFLYS